MQMRYSIEEYSYLYVKLHAIRNMIMNKDQLDIMKSFSNLNDFLNFISLFYPNFSMKEKYASDIESQLQTIYFQLVIHYILLS